MMTSVLNTLADTYTEVKDALKDVVMGTPGEDGREPETTVGGKTRRDEQENAETNEASGAEPKKTKKQKKPKQPADDDQASAPQQQGEQQGGPQGGPQGEAHGEAQGEQQIGSQGEPQGDAHESQTREKRFKFSPESYGGLLNAKKIADSWVAVLGGPIDEMRQASAALDDLDQVGTKAQLAEWRQQGKAVANAFQALQGTVGKNLKVLVPLAVQANARAADLQEKNEQLEAERRTASEAAEEAASKLQQTQVALHQSAAGHSNIASTFPLSTEIADKVATFGADGFAELVLDHALAAAPNLLAATDDLRVLLQFASSAVEEAKERTEAGVFGASAPPPLASSYTHTRDAARRGLTDGSAPSAAALGNVPRSKLIDGFLRQIWQEQHEHLLPTDDVNQCLAALPHHKPAHGSWHMDLSSDELRPCLEKTLRTLLQLYVYTTVCDPPLKLDANLVGQRAKFNSSFHNAMDGSIKPGQQCVCIFPPLLTEYAARILCRSHRPATATCPEPCVRVPGPTT